MRQPSPQTSAWTKEGERKATTATERDPLLQTSPPTYFDSRRQEAQIGSTIRERRSSRSPTEPLNLHFAEHQKRSQMNSEFGDEIPGKGLHQYNIFQDDGSKTGNMSVGDHSGESSSSGSRSAHSLRRHYIASGGSGSGQIPLLEIPEEIYAVRKAALQVLKPLTKTWLIVSVGCALSVLFGMARWTGLLINLPFWFILLPSWLSHVGLFWCHLMSAKALSSFIAEANDSRQRPDSRDHLDRTEYLPLLQRSLKFGLKTGLISFGVFIFEILVYIRLARGHLPMTAVFFPLWIMVLGGVLDGIICKTQHLLRVFCWFLTFSAMILGCLKVDYGFESIRWRMVVVPIVTVLTISSGTLIYIVYGHQVGYYRLTESQLTAGNLYSLAALISIVLVVIVGEVMPLARPVEIETRVFVVLMSPLVVTLVGMGAWVVSRDEFGRLLLYGGQAAVLPRKLRWEKEGWTCVQGKGVTTIPMFGEVSFRPLDKKAVDSSLDSCICCTCYPYEEDEEELVQYVDELNGHPYLAPTPSNSDNPLSYLHWSNASEFRNV